MLNVELSKENRIAILTPEGALKKDDFELAGRQIDPLIEASGKLNGLIIHTEKFPGWDSFGALASHLKFVRDHHREIRRIAFVTDSPIGNLAEKMSSHFVVAEIRAFAYGELEQAQEWVLG